MVIYLRLLYGEFVYSQYVHNLGEPYLVLNFSGMIEGGLQLNLFPPNQFADMDEASFLMWYTDWIMGNEDTFIRFMAMIEEVARGTVVYIIVGNNDFTDGIDETFLKLIKLRYGLKAYYVNDIRDFVEMDLGLIDEIDFDPYYGIRNYNADLVRYNDAKEANRIANGGRPYYD